MNHIKSTYIINDEPCGIKSFDTKMSSYFSFKGIHYNSFDIRGRQNFPNCGLVLFHYVPSMYANNNDSLNIFLKNPNFKIISILHGLYPNNSYSINGDTFNPFVGEQIRLIVEKSQLVISLSNSCLKFLKTWINPLPEKASFVLSHPGFSNIDKMDDKEKYFFFGGIIRSKKNVEGLLIKEFLKKCKSSFINIWLHDTKHIYSNIEEELKKEVWRYSFGEISENEWKKVINNSQMVLFPYNTQLQTVSGMMAEAISLGKAILTTKFPFSIEMAELFPELVMINDDINTWDEYLLNPKTKI